jgi:hypothetical protein
MVMRVGSKSHETPLCYAASRSWKQSKPCDLILSSEGFTSMWRMACSRASFGAITLLNLSSVGQVLGVKLLQLDCDRDVEQCVFACLRLVFTMREQNAAKNPGKAHERATITERAFVTTAAADHLTIKARKPAFKRGRPPASNRFFAGSSIHTNLTAGNGQLAFEKSMASVTRVAQTVKSFSRPGLEKASA